MGKAPSELKLVTEWKVECESLPGRPPGWQQVPLAQKRPGSPLRQAALSRLPGEKKSSKNDTEKPMN